MARLVQSGEPDQQKFNGRADDDPRAEQAKRVFTSLQDIAVDTGGVIGGRKIRSVISVRKPKPNEFVRAHPDPQNYSVPIFLYTDPEDRDTTWYVTQPVVSYFTNGVVCRLITLAVNQTGAAFLWPVPNDDYKTMRNLFNASHRRAYHEAKSNWVKMFREEGADGYTIVAPVGNLPPPQWPEEEFLDLLELGFRGKVIDRADHDIIKGQAGVEI
jgi:hypothetical protein